MACIESLPAWGAWVETCNSFVIPPRAPCRSPHGERGLKQVIIPNTLSVAVSLPAWGAWVETRTAFDGRA